MNLALLNKICFGIAVASIVAGVALGLVMVWTPGVDETLWKLVATVGICHAQREPYLRSAKWRGRRQWERHRITCPGGADDPPRNAT